jgi:hypothetical protein
MLLFSQRNNLVSQPAPDKPGWISDRLRTLLWNDFDDASRVLYRVDRHVGLIVSPNFRHSSSMFGLNIGQSRPMSIRV